MPPKFLESILGYFTKAKLVTIFQYNVLFEDMYFLNLCKGKLQEFLKTIYLILKTLYYFIASRWKPCPIKNEIMEEDILIIAQAHS